MQAIVIPLKVAGIGQASRQIQQLGRQIAGLSQGGGGGGYGGGRGIGGIRPATPNQIAKFAADLQIARNRGYSGPGTATGVYAFNQQRRVQASAPQSFGARLGGVIASSRFGANGLMPLVGKVAGLLGPVGTGAALAISGLKRFAEAVVQSAEDIRKFNNAMLTGGGTSGETALARLLGDETGGKARAFSHAISTDPFAAGAAARAGIHDPGGELFGPIDKTKFYLRWDRYLRSLPLERAMRQARRTGTEDLLQNRNFSRITNITNTATAANAAANMTPDKVAAAVNFNKQLENVKANFESLTTSISINFMKAANVVLPAVNGLLIAGTRFMNSPFGKAMFGIIGHLAALNDLINPPEKFDAQKANTNAIKELTATIKQGVYGGGERARGSVPRAWMGAGEEHWYRQAASLGAFSL